MHLRPPSPRPPACLANHRVHRRSVRRTAKVAIPSEGVAADDPGRAVSADPRGVEKDAVMAHDRVAIAADAGMAIAGPTPKGAAKNRARATPERALARHRVATASGRGAAPETIARDSALPACRTLPKLMPLHKAWQAQGRVNLMCPPTMPAGVKPVKTFGPIAVLAANGASGADVIATAALRASRWSAKAVQLPAPMAACQTQQRMHRCRMARRAQHASRASAARAGGTVAASAATSDARPRTTPHPRASPARPPRLSIPRRCLRGIPRHTARY